MSIIDGGISKPVASHTLEKSRITIGRDQECTLSLVDPEKFVSRIHAEIEEKEGVYWMKVVSKANPVLVNKQRHNFGERVALTTGDILTVGTYRLELLIPIEEAADGTMLYRGGSVVAPGATARVLEEGLSDELTYIHRPTIQKVIPEHKAEPTPALEKGLPAEATYIPLPEQVAIPKRKADPALKRDLSTEATYIPLPEQEAIPEHKTKPNLKKELPVAPPYTPLPAQEVAPQHDVEAAKPEHPADEDASAEITYVRPLKPKKDNAQPHTGNEDGAKRAIRAFFQGVGLDEMEVADPEAFLRDSGEIVRVAIEGIMLLLTTRALALEELGITEPTSANTHSDNMLKSMSTSREAIAFLFDPEKRTSATHDPIQTFGDACADLRAHEIALIEGMRTIALNAILSVDPIAFDRAQEESLSTPGRNRKSKLWDLFIAYHNKLAHDTRNDFKAAFGHDMTSQYLVHFRRLRGGR